MNYITIYFLIIITAFLALALWLGIRLPQARNWKEHLTKSLAIAVELTVCSLGYSVFFFVFTLSVGIGIWLILLGLVYLPADFLHNAIGADLAKSIVNSIKPYVHRSSHSPGLLRQPILDYTTLSVLFFAPVFAIWTTVKKYKERLQPDQASS